MILIVLPYGIQSRTAGACGEAGKQSHGKELSNGASENKEHKRTKDDLGTHSNLPLVSTVGTERRDDVPVRGK